MNWFQRKISELNERKCDMSQFEYDQEYEELLDQRNYGIEEDIGRAVDEQNRFRALNREL